MQPQSQPHCGDYVAITPVYNPNQKLDLNVQDPEMEKAFKEKSLIFTT